MENVPETLDLYFDGVLKTCTLTEDPKAQLKEYLYIAEDGRFTKFASEYAEGDSFEEAVERHNKANNHQVEIIQDVVYGEPINFDKDGNEIK